MKIGKKILIGVLMVTLALGTVAGISVAAEEKGTTSTASGFVNGCRGFFGGAINDLAKLLGLKPEEIYEKRQAGKSLADIAKDQKVSQEDVVSTMVESRKKILDERVKAGINTQEQANLMLENMKARFSERIKDPAAGPGAGGGCCGGGRGGNGPGPGAGFRGGFGPGGFRNAPPAATQSSI